MSIRALNLEATELGPQLEYAHLGLTYLMKFHVVRSHKTPLSEN